MKLGTTSSTSTIHMSVRSRQPPKYPATEPTVAAMTVEMNATQTPISMDFCMPRKGFGRRCPARSGQCRATASLLSVKFGALRDPAGGWSGFDGRPAAVKNFVA